MAKKPKLSDNMKKELQLETKLTFGKIVWPVISFVLIIGVGAYLYSIYITEKNKPDEKTSKSPEEKIENKPDVDPNEVVEEEKPAETPVVEALPAPPVPQYDEYTVVDGDTLGDIATAHGTTMDALLAANPGVVAENIQIGQKIKIPK